MLMHSTETRWICKGQLPEIVMGWFASPLIKAEKYREDLYLRLEECATTGVKLRQGTVEIKGLCVAPQTIVLGPDAVGRFDSWIKWSLTAGEVKQFGRAMC